MSALLKPSVVMAHDGGGIIRWERTKVDSRAIAFMGESGLMPQRGCAVPSWRKRPPQFKAQPEQGSPWLLSLVG